MNARTIAALVLLGLLGVFVFMNLAKASVWFFGIRAEMPVAFVVIASAFLGALGTYAFSSLKPKK